MGTPTDACRRLERAHPNRINENNANKGTKMLVTNQMAALFKKHVIDEKLSPYDV